MGPFGRGILPTWPDSAPKSLDGARKIACPLDEPLGRDEERDVFPEIDCLSPIASLPT